MGGRFGGPLSIPRTYKAKFEIRREVERMAERMRIPECPSCGVHCSVCSSGKIAPPHNFCCLSYPDTGESGEAYDVEMALVEREKE